MKKYIEERVIEVANYIIDTGCTVREAGKVFNVSKSTVFKDITDRLLELNKYQLYKEVEEILKNNKDERHIRGGLATREKYRKERNVKSWVN